MLYVQRDENNRIKAIFNEPSIDATECLARDCQEIRDFLAGPKVNASSFSTLELSMTDLSMIRVVEDLIELLIKKGVIDITELPNNAVEKLIKRRDARRHVANQ